MTSSKVWKGSLEERGDVVRGQKGGLYQWGKRERLL